MNRRCRPVCLPDRWRPPTIKGAGDRALGGGPPRGALADPFGGSGMLAILFANKWVFALGSACSRRLQRNMDQASESRVV
jgi:hypothetical protein